MYVSSLPASYHGVIGLIMTKFPILIWIIGIIGGVTVVITSSEWWAGVLVGFFLIGVLSHAQSLGEPLEGLEDRISVIDNITKIVPIQIDCREYACEKKSQEFL